ncbi:MAG TPA: isoprenylcysteine carboxylmethyltransferase family protein [Anaerolineae bacterium]|nr:isoprenylcysteine carboxylmethyltransferase family protein [Anaerolineae bacterium]
MRNILATIFMLTVLFLAAGHLNWWEAWTYIAMNLAVLIVSRYIMIIKNLDMILERIEAAQKENVKPWDKVLMPLTSFFGPLTSLIVAGFDERFGWSPNLPIAIQIIALAVIFIGNMIGFWSMVANRFFSSHVRIQSDRSHTVVHSGPYHIIRHPGYAASIIRWISTPIFFSSYWMTIPTLMLIIANIVRTSLEDRVLIVELPGYQEYAQEVPYRLVPGVW